MKDMEGLYSLRDCGREGKSAETITRFESGRTKPTQSVGSTSESSTELTVAVDAAASAEDEPTKTK